MSPRFFRSLVLLLLLVPIISCGRLSSIETAPVLPSATSTPESTNLEYREALADIWIEDDHYEIGGISVVRNCFPADEYLGNCELIIKSGRNELRRFSVEHGRKDWLKYGLLDLLGENEKQLIVFTYSGGGHCCYDYSIFDLKPHVRVIYDSTKYDSANEIGNEMVSVDIDADGTSEFYQKVMAFDYFGPGGHASASFPPAIFAYDKNVRRYVIATKRFPDFVMSRLDHITTLAQREKGIDDDSRDEYLVRTKFLYMVYAGKRDDAWEYFDKNYYSRNGDGYQEQFKDRFKKDFRDIFSKDPTYLSIYGR